MVMAVIYTMVGEYDSALNELDYLLSIESPFNVNAVELHEFLEPLRELPRYKQMIDKYRVARSGT